jgi:sigma-E factor negative regulatory protein RseC
MIETEAQVIRIEHEKAWVRIKPHKPCGQCDPEKGCKSVALTRMFGAQQDFRVANPLAAQQGEYVKVAIADGMLLRAAIWAYGVPMLLLIAAALLGQWLAPAQWKAVSSIVAGSAGLIAGVLLLRRQKHLAIRAQPAIVARCDGFSSSCQSNQH